VAGGGIRVVVARWDVGEGTALESGMVLVWPNPKPTRAGVTGGLSSLGPYSLSSGAF
jgi:hypothetical protein